MGEEFVQKNALKIHAFSHITQTVSFVLECSSRAFCLPKLMLQEFVRVDKVLEDLDVKP